MRNRRADGKALPWLRVLLGTLALVFGLGASVAAVRAIRDVVAFRSARSCAETGRDCIRATFAVVVDRHEDKNRRETVTFVVVVSLEGTPREVGFPEPRSLYDSLPPGTEAAVRVWRDRVIEIGTANGDLVLTDSHPRLEAVMWTIFAAMGLTSGAYGLASGIATGRDRGLRHAAEVARSPRLAALVVVAAGTWAAFAAMTWLDVYEVLPLAGFALAGCLVAFVVKRRDLGR